MKQDTTKPKLQYVYFSALAEMAKIRENALKKYPGPEDWRTTTTYQHFNSALRHIFASMEGEELDKDSGFDHLGHAMCNLMFLIEEKRKLEPVLAVKKTKEKKNENTKVTL